MLLQLEAARLRDRSLALLDLGVEEFLDTAAVHAHQVVVVLALVELEHRLAALEVIARQDAGLLELHQHAIDGCQTDIGAFDVYETPGHAPSHICLHQAERGILISGDHLLGRVSLYYDYGYTPDPAGEFLSSLDKIDALPARLCLEGHGRPFIDVKAHIEANRREVAERIGRVRRALEEGAKTPFEIVPVLMQYAELTPMMVNWGLSETLCYLRYLELRDGARRVGDEEPERWALVA